jgi:hypothetical protein
MLIHARADSEQRSAGNNIMVVWGRTTIFRGLEALWQRASVVQQHSCCCCNKIVLCLDNCRHLHDHVSSTLTSPPMFRTLHLILSFSALPAADCCVLPAAAAARCCCCLLLPAAAAAAACCCPLLLLPAAARCCCCCCLLLPAAAAQTAERVTREVVSTALSACGRTMDDYRDPDKRHSFHAQYGKLAVSAGDACVVLVVVARGGGG